MGFFIGLLFVVFAVIAGIVGGYKCSNGNSVSGVIAWVVCVALVFGFIFVPFSMHTVDAYIILQQRMFMSDKYTESLVILLFFFYFSLVCLPFRQMELTAKVSLKIPINLNLGINGHLAKKDAGKGEM